jgi:hypothetical protein
MAWRGNPNNPVPNFVQFGAKLSEEKHIKREEQIRRDTDDHKSFEISYDQIDEAIMKQLEKFQLQVVDDGKQIKVPVNYASPEKWKSIQKDGYMRDYDGNIILPAIVFGRTSTKKDPSLPNFSPYTTYSTLRTYSPKNRYTQFSTLVGQNAPVQEVYQVSIPDGIIATYKFVVWTEYVAQMNKLIQRLSYESDDYWGDARGFRFRVWAEDFTHTTELQVDQDRMVKTEFDLQVWGYILPDINYGIDGPHHTTKKFFTPKKVIINNEVVTTDYDFQQHQMEEREKWRNQNAPNLPADQPLPVPPVVGSPELQTESSASIA